MLKHLEFSKKKALHIFERKKKSVRMSCEFSKTSPLKREEKPVRLEEALLLLHAVLNLDSV
jgi:hypothetical protein